MHVTQMLGIKHMRFSDKVKLYYLLKGIDTEITPIFGKWLCEVNKAYDTKL